jgi:hypothetical protein
MLEHTPTFPIEDALQSKKKLRRTKETTFELVEADAGVEHAHRPRHLGEIAVVGVVERRPHEVAHLRSCPVNPTWTPAVATAAGRSHCGKEGRASVITKMGLSPATIPDEYNAAGTHRTRNAARLSAGIRAANSGAIGEAEAAVAARESKTGAVCVRVGPESGADEMRNKVLVRPSRTRTADPNPTSGFSTPPLRI